MIELPLTTDPSALPTCRHRGEVPRNGRYQCGSTKLHTPRGVTAEFCRTKCYCVDHEPVADRPTPPAVRSVRPVQRGPCSHLGQPTGAVRECPSCGGGRVRLKVRACTVHGECTEGRKVDGLACCADCPEYQAAAGSRSAEPIAAPGSSSVPPARRTVRILRGSGPAIRRASGTVGIGPVGGPRRWAGPPGILLTGGIGDVFALESRLAPADRDRLEAVYYAAPAAAELRVLMEALPNYPRLKTHVVLPTGRRTHYRRATVERAVGRLPVGVEDWSIGRIFPRRLPFVGSSFLAHKVASPELPPAPFVIVNPHSSWGQWNDRNFNDRDWTVCLDFLDRHALTGVVLCRERFPLPTHPRLLDWQGRTTILETVEVVKAAAGYVGIDSALSVLAAQLWPAGRIAVKGFGGWLLANLATYYAPHVEFPFVRPSLEAPAWTP